MGGTFDGARCVVASEMTRIAEYPEEITDALAWRTEVGIVAFRDGRLDVFQLAEFVGRTPLEVCDMLGELGLRPPDDDIWWAQELAGIAAMREARLAKDAKAVRVEDAQGV